MGSVDEIADWRAENYLESEPAGSLWCIFLHAGGARIYRKGTTLPIKEVGEAPAKRLLDQVTTCLGRPRRYQELLSFQVKGDGGDSK